MELKKLFAAGAASLALLASTPALADAQAEASATTTAAAEATGPALWKVADEDTTIYIFGTVHMLPDNVEWNSGVVNKALASSDALVTEVDMNPEKMAAMGAMFQEKGMLTTGQTLRDLMSEEQRATYEAGLAKVGIPAAAFDPLEPWAAALALVQVI
ncbi:MAG: TraB/GumN family protein, partial [Erythrobacter sp.]|nr:TraB/GumN family protein [Erythrobacter sp.]